MKYSFSQRAQRKIQRKERKENSNSFAAFAGHLLSGLCVKLYFNHI